MVKEGEKERKKERGEAIKKNQCSLRPMDFIRTTHKSQHARTGDFHIKSANSAAILSTNYLELFVSPIVKIRLVTFDPTDSGFRGYQAGG
jgi:hypothetical protein